jgi:hypothetical protein
MPKFFPKASASLPQENAEITTINYIMSRHIFCRFHHVKWLK